MQNQGGNNWVPGEDALLDLHQFSSGCVLICGRRGGQKKRENKREKKKRG